MQCFDLIVAIRITILSSVFEGNTAQIGGALFLTLYANVYVFNSKVFSILKCNFLIVNTIILQFYNNTATTHTGGAIHAIGGAQLAIMKSEIKGNKAGSSGGAICIDGDMPVTIAECIFLSFVPFLNHFSYFCLTTKLSLLIMLPQLAVVFFHLLSPL